MNRQPPSPSPSHPPAASEGTALSRDLADFLVQLSIALHKHAIYPPAHPMLAGAVDGVIARLSDLLTRRATLSLGVARNQLVIEGVATDPANPLLRELAHRLHRHQLSAVKFSTGVTSPEIAAFISTVAVDADRTGEPLGAQAERAKAWPHVRFHQQSYSQLQLLEREDTETHAEASGGGAQIWVGLARAALGFEEGVDAAASTDPTAIAHVIDAGSHEEAYEQVIVGYLLQIASELKKTGPTEDEALRRQVTELVRGLKPETVRRLLGMGGDTAQRRQFVLDAAQGMAADAVLEVVKAAADASGQTISHSLLRLLSKFAAHAGTGEDGPGVRADAALREQVTRLVSDWELEDPNPDAYRSVLEGMSHVAPSAGAMEAATAADSPRIIAMSLELGVNGPPTWRAVEDMLATGQTSALLDLIGESGPENEAAAEIWRRIATRDRVREVLSSEPVDFALLEHMVARLGMAAAEPMLDVLATAQLRATRWKLLTLLEQLGSDVAPLAAERFSDAPWYVQRNLLVVLGKLPALPAEFAVAPYARHPDARVRREAVRILLKQPGDRGTALRAALGDADQQIVQLGLGAAVEGCPDSVASLVAHHAMDKKWEPHVRALAIRALAPMRSHDTLETLLRVVMAKRKLLGRARLASRSPEVLAALAGLAANWRDEPRAARALMLASRSTDSEIRAAVESSAQ